MNKQSINRRMFLNRVAMASASSLLFPRVSGIALAAEPTLEETIAWLRDKLLKDEGWTGEYSADRYIDLTFVDKTLSLTSVYRYTGNLAPMGSTTSQWIVPLQKMNPKIEYPGREFVIRCTGGETNVRLLNLTKKTEEKRAWFQVRVSTDEFGKRVANALSHAVKLCGGTDKTNEPF